MKCLLLLLFAWTLSTNGSAQEEKIAVYYYGDSITDLTKGAIFSDLDDYASGIEENHIDPFTHISRKEFFKKIEALKGKVATYNVDELFMEWVKINALIKDEHTLIAHLPCYRFPFNGYYCADGVYITGTDKDNSKLNHSRVIAVNGLSMEAVMEKLKPIARAVNESDARLTFIYYLFSPLVIHGLQMSKTRVDIEYTFVTPQNDTIRLKPVASMQKIEQLTGDTIKNKFLRTTNNKNANWHTYVNEGDYMYCRIRGCGDREDDSLIKQLDNMQEEITNKHIKKVVVDLRDNSCDNPPSLLSFIDFLSTRPYTGSEQVYVLIGRRTSSAAAIKALAFKTRARAILLGEETDGSANYYGDPHTFKLPKTKLRVLYSTKKFDSGVGYEGPLRPDIIIPELFSDYITHTDAALQHVAKHQVK